jgi:hypothetical protein
MTFGKNLGIVGLTVGDNLDAVVTEDTDTRVGGTPVKMVSNCCGWKE